MQFINQYINYKVLLQEAKGMKYSINCNVYCQFKKK